MSPDIIIQPDNYSKPNCRTKLGGHARARNRFEGITPSPSVKAVNPANNAPPATPKKVVPKAPTAKKTVPPKSGPSASSAQPAATLSPLGDVGS